MDRFALSAIPGELEWKHQPLDWKVEAGDRWLIVAGDHTDWFVDPSGSGYNPDSAPCALFAPPHANFILNAKVTVNFASNYDAAVFQLRESDELSAKLCFEYSPNIGP